MQLGDRLGPYEIRGCLGQGGMARVYEAWHTQLHRLEAIKVPTGSLSHGLPSEQVFVKRFLHEASISARLHHPHIATIYNVSEPDAATPYFSMEHVAGDDLAELLAEKGRLSLEETLAIIEPVAHALDYAHSQGIIHRDVKPGNILLGKTPYGWLPKVVDFGIAQAAVVEGEDPRTRLTQSGSVVGTPEYMSPEQAEGLASKPVQHPSDIYSLGIVVYEMLAGRTPFSSGSAISILMSQVRDEPPPLSAAASHLPPQISAAVCWALAKDPAERPQSCLAYVRALQELLTPDSPPPPPPSSSVLVRTMVVALLVGGMALVGSAMWQRGGQELPPQPTPTPQSTASSEQTEAMAFVEKAEPAVDEAAAELRELENRVVAKSISREDAIELHKKMQAKLIQARDDSWKAITLHRGNEDAWVVHCRALYHLSACSLISHLDEAEKIFTKSKRFKPIRAMAEEWGKDDCEK